MSRRVKKPLRPAGNRPKGARPYRGSQAERSKEHRPGSKTARFAAPRAPKPFVPEPEKVVTEAPPLPTKVQTVVVIRAHRDSSYASVYGLLRTCKEIGFRRLQLRALTLGRES